VKKLDRNIFITKIAKDPKAGTACRAPTNSSFYRNSGRPPVVLH